MVWFVVVYIVVLSAQQSGVTAALSTKSKKTTVL